MRRTLSGQAYLRDLRQRTLEPDRGPETPFDACRSGELERRLEHALASLPVDQRELLVLVGVEQMTPTEVARYLKLRPATVRKRLERARRALAARLPDLKDPPPPSPEGGQ